MQRKCRRLQAAMAGAGLLILILDSTLTVEYARAGIELCLETVIPSLFPLMVLSMVLTGSLRVSTAGPVGLLIRVLGIPKSTASVLIPSFLGGYPVGASCIGGLYRRKQLTRDQAQRMLAFCSNAGPAFLFGMVSASFPDRKSVWLLWFIHAASALLTALTIPAAGTDSQTQEAPPDTDRGAVLVSAAKAMGLICCWVVLFRILVGFLNVWFFRILPVWLQVLLTGILELTNGCCCLHLLPQEQLRFVLCACMLSFGGICVLMQTASVIGALSIGSYLKGKLLQTLFSLLLSCLFLSDTGVYFSLLLLPLAVFLRKIQNRYGNPGMIPV